MTTDNCASSRDGAKRPRTTSPSPGAVSKRSKSGSHPPSEDEPKQKPAVNGNGTRRQRAPSRTQLDKEPAKEADEVETEAPEASNRRKERTARRKGDGQRPFHPTICLLYLQFRQIPNMKMVLQPRPHLPSLRPYRRALIPQHPKSLLPYGRQPASRADLPLAVVVLGEINIRKTGTPMATAMPVIWRTRRAEANPTR